MTDAKKPDGKSNGGEDRAGGAHRADGEYRDDPAEFAQSSDYAQQGTTGQYSGGGPSDSATYGTMQGGRGNNAGSQEDWRGGGDAGQPRPAVESPNAATATASAPTPNGDGEVQSRSADTGQGSHGGFEGEGPSRESDPRNHEAAQAVDKSGPTKPYAG